MDVGMDVQVHREESRCWSDLLFSIKRREGGKEYDKTAESMNK